MPKYTADATMMAAESSGYWIVCGEVANQRRIGQTLQSSFEPLVIQVQQIINRRIGGQYLGPGFLHFCDDQLSVI
ncbi:MAG: hypothetical protein IPH75_08140 [bacterium]|nr:hypothetical protein [bacterium]